MASSKQKVKLMKMRYYGIASHYGSRQDPLRVRKKEVRISPAFTRNENFELIAEFKASLDALTLFLD
ncbi:hypothetical protein COLO4_15220 [Corchorus olitorius]|uniref:Uncharacterized protein n=1 Tax=Corchorus olitorius TaxID=93759 RepID=A0A1R3JP02_9ROSI|nr:hypothetical protein COLO4_15220 [Corchorus olitorius]